MNRWKTILLWVVTAVITLSSVVYQRATGPTHPASGQISLHENSISYSLLRSYNSGENMPISIKVPSEQIEGKVLWKRYKTNDPVTATPMEYKNDQLYAVLPTQPPAGKLEYQVLLEYGEEHVIIPDEPAVMRYKGAVPGGVLLPHILFMFIAMFMASRVMLGAVIAEPMKWKVYLTVAFLFVGGLILGPIVQKYAFGAYWTGWPFGEDLTDNKTLVAFLVWLPALWFMHKENGKKRARWWLLFAGIIMFAVYLIPHSMRGSELKYEEIDAIEQSADTSVETGNAERLDSTATDVD